MISESEIIPVVWVEQAGIYLACNCINSICKYVIIYTLNTLIERSIFLHGVWFIHTTTYIHQELLKLQGCSHRHLYNSIQTLQLLIIIQKGVNALLE